MKISVQLVSFQSAVKVATYPEGGATSPFNGKPAIVITGKWLTFTKEGIPVYPTPHAQGKGRYRQHVNRGKQQKKLEAKVHELEKRLKTLEASKRGTL